MSESMSESISPLDSLTLKGWEQRRELIEEAELALLDAPAELTVAGERQEIVALCGRLYAGLGVQLLWNRETGDTFVTVTLAGENETFEVPRDRAFDAFEHPYAYGATLAL